MDIYIARGEERNGPYSEDAIRQFLADGQLDGTELAYHEGLVGWVNVKDAIPRKVSLATLKSAKTPVIADRDDWPRGYHILFERYEMVKRQAIRKFMLPAVFLWIGGSTYYLIAQAKHFGYPWYGWPPNYVPVSDTWDWALSGAKEPIIMYALSIVGTGLFLWGKWQKYLWEREFRWKKFKELSEKYGTPSGLEDIRIE